MSNGEVRKVSLQDIQLVQNLIERCLQLYMTQREVVSTLLHQAKIEPDFTELVWLKLEAENQDFFKAYNLRLIVKDQILRFNQLLNRQVELMRQISQTGPVSMPHSTESQIHSMHNNIPYQSPQQSMKPENIHQVINAIPHVYTNGASPMQQCMPAPTNNMTIGLSRRIDFPEDNMVLAQSPNAGMMQGMNGIPSVKPECGYTSDSSIMFGAENNILETHNGIGEPLSSFNGRESSSQALSEILDTERSSFEILEHMTRNFSLSDLTADFSNSTDILESYSRSPFLGPDVKFMDPHIPGEHNDIRRMDSISEGFSYEDFSSD